ncbi:circularly permuted type 2 ATP-grasp protein [Marinomonas sp. 15G1-11]|uniref:Circularly permuted type 2 ATP-grasp protein n=1 Tax=Marinomonas phaeophyticola TaxID=3004091 RepID=A0ABT4JXS2_9GAMM|nr:circularly permuted type 2 ATP-grasp protein [Marinomonas sp. 15G1-11]MCZ2723190.1 circularly permuted type 2 ATP-grasp protein [Marinomonas sp. 15G1-11]
MQIQSQTSSLTEPNELKAELSWYPLSEGTYDEAFTESRTPRPHWQSLFESISTLGKEGLSDRERRAQRILRDDGATYNLAAEPMSPKIWGLDPIPLILNDKDWLQIESSLIERSSLFDLILKDIYGPRNLIKDGIIPPEVIYGHPGFLRACQGMSVPGNHNLLLHAVDMVRTQNGRFCVIGDRTQAPSGAGYALENRTVLSRVMPSIFRGSNAHRLAYYFQALRNMLAKLVADKTDDPRIVIMTSGAYSSSYFEQALLANYLGYSLVQGRDLTVRNGHVWLKSLQGLEKVDVILRRVDDAFCDQAELRSDSFMGVPGILEAIRSGNVVMANPLGSGILETPALLKYLPKISQYFLGQDLSMESVQTWWCGDADDFKFVKENLRNLIIKPAIRSASAPSVYGRQLSNLEESQLLARIKQAPHRYTAQSYLAASHTPSWQNDEICSRPSILRTFTVSNEDSYSVMSGGLTRVCAGENDTIVTNYNGSMSKDTWVMSDESRNDLTLVNKQEAPHGIHHSNLPSRVVENLFWMGRYSERAEMTMRLLRTVFSQMNGVDSLPKECRDVLFKAVSVQTGCIPGFCEESEALLNNPEPEFVAIVADGTRIGSVKSNLLALLTCAEEIKEMLSADTRKIINNLRDYLFELDRAYINGLPEAPEESLDSLVTCLLALSGLNHESMLRGIDWKFQEIGRRTERAIQTATLLRSTLTVSLSQLNQQQVLESVLLSVEALISFRRRYRTQVEVEYGLDLLMLDETNPRSLYYQINQLQNLVNELPRSKTALRDMSAEVRLIMQSLNDIQLANLDALSVVDPVTDQREKLNQLMMELEENLVLFTSKISDKYFDHKTSGPQKLVSTEWGNDV